MTWSAERIDTMTLLWKDGLTATDIAAKLGGVTRCAVLGKLDRLGIVRSLPKGKRAEVARKEQRLVRTAAAPGPTAPKLPAPTRIDLQSKRLTFDELNASTCRWPEGESDYRYCGHQVEPGEPYCPEHGALAYTADGLQRRRALRRAKAGR